MADEFNSSTNWWGDSSRININRFDAAAAGSSSSSSSGLNSTNIGSFGWPTDQMVDIKSSAAGRSSMDSVSVSDGNNSVVFHDTQKLQVPESAHHDHHHLHMMGLGLSSQAIDWNQALLTREDKAHGSSFRSMLQENLNSNTAYQQETGIGMASSAPPSSSSQVQWMREKISFPITGDNSAVNEFKQLNRGFSLDHQSQFSSSSTDHSSNSTVSCQGLPSSTSNFQQMDSNSANLYGSPILQGLLGSDHDHDHHQQSSFDQNRSSLMSYHSHQYGGSSNSMNYGMMNSNEQLMLPSCWSNNNKVAQFLRASPPKQQQPPPHNSQLHFSNNAPFWTASATSSVNSFLPSLQTQFPTPNFDEKPKNISEIRDSSSAVKKSGSDQPTSKRPRNETASPLPPFKVRKEKMGDRITALQQLVSPFGKTDTASVLSEAIEYIKFLHEQVTVLSTPYMKSGAPLQHQQNSDKSKIDPEGYKQDLRSRGLCLVPVSSTFPVTHETAVDFWTPTFGGTFR